jgi:hypothetical protein
VAYQNSDKGRFNHGGRKRKGRVGRWFAELYYLRRIFGYSVIGVAILTVKWGWWEESFWGFLTACLAAAGFEIVINALIDEKLAAARQEELDTRLTAPTSSDRVPR